MLGYVHLTAGRPVLERRAAAGMTYWALEGDLDGGLFPGRRLRRWIGRLERCGVSHAALPPGREGDFAPLRPVLPDGLRLALLPQLLDALAPPGTRPCCWRTAPTAGPCWRPRSWPGASGTCGWRRGRGRRPWSGSCCGSWG